MARFMVTPRLRFVVTRRLTGAWCTRYLMHGRSVSQTGCDLVWVVIILDWKLQNFPLALCEYSDSTMARQRLRFGLSKSEHIES